MEVPKIPELAYMCTNLNSTLEQVTASSEEISATMQVSVSNTDTLNEIANSLNKLLGEFKI